MIVIRVSIDERGLKAMLAFLDTLRGTEITIGPGDAYHTRLLALLEAGSPIRHIPPRPLLMPALSAPETRKKIAAALITSGPDAAGRAAVEAVRAYPASGKLTPNAPVTLSGGWMRSGASGKSFHIAGKKSSTPLVNTGGLLASITYAVRKQR